MITIIDAHAVSFSVPCITYVIKSYTHVLDITFQIPARTIVSQSSYDLIFDFPLDHVFFF